MHDADGDGQVVDAGLGDEALGLGHVGVVGRPVDLLVSVGDLAELCLDDDPVGMRDVDDASSGRDVLLERQVGAVVHDRREAHLDGLEALIPRAVVEVQD